MRRQIAIVEGQRHAQRASDLLDEPLYIEEVDLPCAAAPVKKAAPKKK